VSVLPSTSICSRTPLNLPADASVPPNAWKYAQVGVLKNVGAGKKGLVDALRPQGTGLPVRPNFSGRLRIQQHGAERHWPIVGHRVQRQFVNFEPKRFCSGSAGSKLHQGAVRNKLVDNHRGRLCAASRWRRVVVTVTGR
jgi:hypothetical protein